MGLALLSGACGGDGPEPPPGAEDAPVAVEVERTGPDTLDVVMDEYLIAMPSPLVAGPNVLRLVNQGFEEHNVYFKPRDGEEPVWSLQRRLSPGERLVTTVELEAGSYTAICDFSGHDARGMFAEFTVEADDP